MFIYVNVYVIQTLIIEIERSLKLLNFYSVSCFSRMSILNTGSPGFNIFLSFEL